MGDHRGWAAAFDRAIEAVEAALTAAMFGRPARDPERLLDELGVDATGTLVLYAPARPRRPGLDLERFAVELGAGFVLLARLAEQGAGQAAGPGAEQGTGHGTGRAAGQGAAHRGGTVVDVSGIGDQPLLRIADVLVTDHAPVVFDYARLDRPMFFHVPDLRESASFDLVHEAPGPVVCDLDALVEAVRDFRTFAELYAPARRAFADRHRAPRRRWPPRRTRA